MSSEVDDDDEDDEDEDDDYVDHGDEDDGDDSWKEHWMLMIFLMLTRTKTKILTTTVFHHNDPGTQILTSGGFADNGILARWGRQ